MHQNKDSKNHIIRVILTTGIVMFGFIGIGIISITFALNSTPTNSTTQPAVAGESETISSSSSESEEIEKGTDEPAE